MQCYNIVSTGGGVCSKHEYPCNLRDGRSGSKRCGKILTSWRSGSKNYDETFPESISSCPGLIIVIIIISDASVASKVCLNV